MRISRVVQWDFVKKGGPEFESLPHCISDFSFIKEIFQHFIINKLVRGDIKIPCNGLIYQYQTKLADILNYSIA